MFFGGWLACLLVVVVVVLVMVVAAVLPLLSLLHLCPSHLTPPGPLEGMIEVQRFFSDEDTSIKFDQTLFGQVPARPAVLHLLRPSMFLCSCPCLWWGMGRGQWSRHTPACGK